MKLIRFGTAGKEKPGVIINEKRYDVSSIVSDYNESFFENDGLETLKKALQSNPVLPEVDENIRLGSPVARPSKIICIGFNYVDHCRETNAPIPTEPIIFFKSIDSLKVAVVSYCVWYTFRPNTSTTETTTGKLDTLENSILKLPSEGLGNNLKSAMPNCSVPKVAFWVQIVTEA